METTTFEEKLRFITDNATGVSNVNFKMHAQELFSLARKEVEKDHVPWEKGYNQGYKEGWIKALEEIEALYDRENWLDVRRIPVWRRIQRLKAKEI